MRSARWPNQAASFVVAGMAVCALVLAVASARAADDAGCSDFSVASAETCTALIEKGGRSDMASLYVRRGEFYQGRGMLDLALSDFTEALRLSPGRMDAYYRRGLAYRDSNRLEEALADLNQAVREDRQVGPRLARAGVLELLHDNERALEDYNYAVGRAPEFAPAYLDRGEFWLRTGNPDRAKSDFDRAIALKSESADAFFGRAKAARQVGSFDDAISDYMRAIELAPDRADYRAALDDAYKIKAAPDLANAEQELLKQGRWTVPQHAELHGSAGPSPPSPAKIPSPASAPAPGGFQWPPSAGAPVSVGTSPFGAAPTTAAALALAAQALTHSQKGQFSTALAELDQLIVQLGENSGLYDARASVLIRMGQLDRAKADVDRALAIDPANLDAQAHAVNILDEQGEHARALAEFDRILAANPQHIPAHIGKGAVLLQLGQLDRALTEFDRALAVTPNTMQVDALVARGIALALKGRIKEANANVERALDLGPDHAKALVGQGIVLLTSKQLDRAITVLGRSIGDGNEDPMVFVLRGKALAQTGALDRALADFDQALKLRPRNAEALTARGTVWMKKKDYARALADLDQSIDARPTISGYVVRGALHETQGRCSLAMADYRQARELKAGGSLESDAQVIAKSRLDQYARRKSCGPVGEHKLASNDFGAAL